VAKGAGLTSFQVVAHLRRLLRVPKMGHGGTLDPGATGVLPILIGEATKLTPYLVDLDKEYLATVRLGVATDTQDPRARHSRRGLSPPSSAPPWSGA
jgi:tRNA pseudouridine55 synthase